MGGVEQVRVEFTAEGVIKVMRIGLEEAVATPLPPYQQYETAKELPAWLQERISILSITDDDTQPPPTVPDVGTRIGKNVFWVIAPMENEDG